ncbi:MAG TPA: aminomethyl-transferring glycine dehydrogenase subunit GcvPA [Clostridiales bacterium]|nr:aminomethyl-transferring glycine dehydrogenase subunit GcvPA [Clostridiales bacterium]HQK74010.1 aminomethyl-transferring glycine dehydrogenase subunit GcvPA [Clostridiales bacterium]
MSYIPSTPEERLEMLGATGAQSMEDLFSAVPDHLRFKGLLDLPPAASEFEVISALKEMAGRNKVYQTWFRGAGSYRHYIPSVVRHLASRAEFVTAYTPYQAEISQGILQSIFEYQTLICELTGMDVSNAGVYDGAHAAAEACAMFADKNRPKVLAASTVKPMTAEVLRTYCRVAGRELEFFGAEDGKASSALLEQMLDTSVCCVYAEQPNFYGLVEDYGELTRAAHAAGAKMVIGSYPIALAVLKTPAEYGADAAVGEAQPLGMPPAFGGPYLGYMAVKAADARKLPGRIAGATVDAAGRTAYVLTLQAREQHIRREKASSNICSNQALCALTATVYCAAAGPGGLKEIAMRCVSLARYAARRISAVSGFSMMFEGFFFNEFVTRCPVDPAKLETKLAENDMLCGLPVQTEKGAGILWCLTERNTKDEIDRLVRLLGEVSA